MIDEEIEDDDCSDDDGLEKKIKNIEEENNEETMNENNNTNDDKEIINNNKEMKILKRINPKKEEYIEFKKRLIDDLKRFLFEIKNNDMLSITCSKIKIEMNSFEDGIKNYHMNESIVNNIGTYCNYSRFKQGEYLYNLYKYSVKESKLKSNDLLTFSVFVSNILKQKKCRSTIDNYIKFYTIAVKYPILRFASTGYTNIIKFNDYLDNEYRHNRDEALVEILKTKLEEIGNDYVMFSNNKVNINHKHADEDYDAYDKHKNEMNMKKRKIDRN